MERKLIINKPTDKLVRRSKYAPRSVMCSMSIMYECDAGKGYENCEICDFDITTLSCKEGKWILEKKDSISSLYKLRKVT